MPFGEASLEDHLEEYKGMVSESEKTLGVRFFHLAPPTTTVERDRLGGVKKIEKVSEPEEIVGGSFSFSPSDEELKRVGIQERIDALLMLAKSDLPLTFDRINSRFIVETGFRGKQEFKIKQIQPVGQVKNDWVYLAIGLVVM